VLIPLSCGYRGPPRNSSKSSLGGAPAAAFIHNVSFIIG
jgi:hypothetical protein